MNTNFFESQVEDALINALIGRSVRSSAVKEETKEQTAVKKDNDNWDAESPVNGQAGPAYANDIVNNNKDDQLFFILFRQ